MLKSPSPNPTSGPTRNSSSSADLLPDPDAFPKRIVAIWDGQCKFCRAQVRNLSRLDWTGQLTFISLHDQRVSQRYPQLSYDQLMEQLWIVTPQGDQFGGADAVRYLSRRMPSLWLLAPAMHLPWTMPVWRALYRWVANRRYRIAGRDCSEGTCSLHGSPGKR